MKKIILFLSLATALLSYGQNNNISEVTFYGVDFSMVKVFGADESGAQFKNAFNGINKLFITEPKKYNIPKYMGVRVNEILQDAVNGKNDEINISKLHTTVSYNIATDDMIQEVVDKFPVEDENGAGLIFIAEFLDKVNNQGYYKVVFFDKHTKEILKIKSGKGKAKGSGLRNFWAGSIYDMMKKMK